jgi:hypothetical protein
MPGILPDKKFKLKSFQYFCFRISRKKDPVSGPFVNAFSGTNSLNGLDRIPSDMGKKMMLPFASYGKPKGD